MPIYEYHCKKCGEFEVTQKITATHLKRCPTCRGKVTKLMSNTSFQLKGTGWYITDYGRKDSGSKESGTASKESGTTSKESKAEKSTPATDTKPSKTETKASTSKEAAAA